VLLDAVACLSGDVRKIGIRVIREARCVRHTVLVVVDIATRAGRG